MAIRCDTTLCALVKISESDHFSWHVELDPLPWTHRVIVDNHEAEGRSKRQGAAASRRRDGATARYQGSGPASLEKVPVGPSGGKSARRTGSVAAWATVRVPE